MPRAHEPNSSRRDRKIAAILDAAPKLFMQTGFVGTSMDAVAAAAKVSKPTLYSYFENKDALFAAVIRDRTQTIWNHSAEEISTKPNLRDQLIGLAERFLAVAYAPQSLVLFRLLIGESSRFPQLTKIIHENAMLPIVTRATQLLADTPFFRADARELAWAVDQFLDLLSGSLIRVLLGLSKPPQKADHSRMAARSVDMFLAAYDVESVGRMTGNGQPKKAGSAAKRVAVRG